jgi:hypothetical protein
MKRARTVPVLVAALALAGCLEPPVSESLAIRMLDGGASIVTIEVALRDPDDYRDEVKVRQRLEAHARALDEGSDTWSARLRAGEPEKERRISDREAGRLVRATRQARFTDAADLRAFFRDTGVGVSFDHGEGWDELTLLPGRSARPTSAQRERVKRTLDVWSDALVVYFGKIASLYGYLGEHPDRARACLGALVDTLPDGESLDARERELIESANDAMSSVVVVLTSVEEDAYTLDELSRMVYDPFPAPIRVAVPGAVLEREGFSGEDTALRIPTASFWSAFERLEGRWVSPDPAIAAWKHDAASDGRSFDVAGFASLPRRAQAPHADDVRKAIEGELRTAPVYRVRWTPAATKDDGSAPF